MPACPYQDSNKSRISIREKVIITKSSNKGLGDVKRTGLLLALAGIAFMSVVPAFLFSDVSRHHSSVEEQQDMGARVR